MEVVHRPSGSFDSEALSGVIYSHGRFESSGVAWFYTGFVANIIFFGMYIGIVGYYSSCRYSILPGKGHIKVNWFHEVRAERWSSRNEFLIASYLPTVTNRYTFCSCLRSTTCWWRKSAPRHHWMQRLSSTGILHVGWTGSSPRDSCWMLTTPVVLIQLCELLDGLEYATVRGFMGIHVHILLVGRIAGCIDDGHWVHGVDRRSNQDSLDDVWVELPGRNFHDQHHVRPLLLEPSTSRKVGLRQGEEDLPSHCRNLFPRLDRLHAGLVVRV